MNDVDERRASRRLERSDDGLAGPRGRTKGLLDVAEARGMWSFKFLGARGKRAMPTVLDLSETDAVAGRKPPRLSASADSLDWVVGRCDWRCRSRTTALTSISIRLWHPERRPSPRNGPERRPYRVVGALVPGDPT